MSQARFYPLIVKCLLTAPDHRAVVRDVYDTVARDADLGEGPLHTAGDGDRRVWQHAVRTAMQYLKAKDVIRYLGAGVWGLGEADWRPWAGGVAQQDLHGERDTTASHGPKPASDQAVRSAADADPTAPGAPIPACPAVLDTAIADVMMPLRLRNRLATYGARSLRDVLGVDEERFARIAGVGEKTLADLHKLQEDIRRGEPVRMAPPVGASQEAMGRAEGEAPREPISLTTPLGELTLSTRLFNRLREHGSSTIGDVLRIDMATFAQMRGVGVTTVAELYDLRAWIREHVPGAADVADSEPPPDRGELRADARRTLRSLVEDPDSEAPTADMAAIAELAPAEGPITSLSALLHEVIERTNVRRSTGDPERDCTIWLAYHGVLTGKTKTLEVLARRNRLSRERVRQIIATVTRWAGALLRMDERYAPQLQAVRNAFGSCLGVARLQDFAPLVQRAAGWAEPPTRECLVALAILLQDTPDAFTIENGSGIVRHARACGGLWEAVSAAVHAAIDNAGEGQHVLDFAYSLAHHAPRCVRPEGDGGDLPLACCGARDGQARLPETYVRALLSTLDPCPLYGDTVLGADWAYLRFGRMKKEVVRAALRLIGRPVHYSELAQFIRAHNRRWQRADDRSIHACLTSHDEFVVTQGLGVYGLREWEVQRYRTAADHIEAYLRRRGRPAPMMQIVSALEAEGVPESNVRASFGQRRFTQQSDATIGLSEWAEEGQREVAVEHPAGSLFADDGEDSFIMG